MTTLVKAICHSTSGLPGRKRRPCTRDADWMLICAYDPTLRYPTCTIHWSIDTEPPILEIAGDVDAALDAMYELRRTEQPDTSYMYVRYADYPAVRDAMERRMAAAMADLQCRMMDA